MQRPAWSCPAQGRHCEGVVQGGIPAAGPWGALLTAGAVTKGIRGSGLLLLLQSPQHGQHRCSPGAAGVWGKGRGHGGFGESLGMESKTETITCRMAAGVAGALLYLQDRDKGQEGILAGRDKTNIKALRDTLSGNVPGTRLG